MSCPNIKLSVKSFKRLWSLLFCCSPSTCRNHVPSNKWNKPNSRTVQIKKTKNWFYTQKVQYISFSVLRDNFLSKSPKFEWTPYLGLMAVASPTFNLSSASNQKVPFHDVTTITKTVTNIRGCVPQFIWRHWTIALSKQGGKHYWGINGFCRVVLFFMHETRPMLEKYIWKVRCWFWCLRKC